MTKQELNALTAPSEAARHMLPHMAAGSDMTPEQAAEKVTVSAFMRSVIS